MIKDYIKTIYLIAFALIGPISLPAGGIQRNLEENLNTNSKEIILDTNSALYCFPNLNAKKLRSLDPGSSLQVLRHWKVSEDNFWVRVKLSTNPVIGNLEQPKKGWIKI